MAKTALLFQPVLQFFDNSGAVLNGGTLTFSIAGTSTAKDTYADSAKAVTNPNPITLDSAGRPDNTGSAIQIWLDGSYKLVVKDSSGATIRTEDNITALAEAAGYAAKSANYTILDTDFGQVINVDASAAARTITLLAAATAGAGFPITVTKSDSTGNLVTIDGDGTETINGATTHLLAEQYDSVELVSDGSNWIIVSQVFGGTQFSTGAAGATAVSQTSPGIKLTAAAMDATNKYTPGVMFGSTDTDFTTTNPKWSAGIFGYATEAYAADTDAGMGLEFFTVPDDGGATPTPTSAMTIDQDGNVVVPGGNFTMTLGNAVLTSGNLTLTSGNAVLTLGNLTLTDGDFTMSKGTVTIADEDSRTNTVDDLLTLTSTTDGTPAAGIGTGILIQAESADEAPSDFGRLSFAADDITAGSEDTYLDIQTRVAGAALASTYQAKATGANKAIFTHANSSDRTYTLADNDATLGAGWEKISTATASSSASLEFTGLSSAYTTYCCVLNNVLPATDAVDMHLTVSDSGGYETTGYFYHRQNSRASSTNGTAGAANAAQWVLLNDLSNGAGEYSSGLVYLYNIGTTARPQATTELTEISATGNEVRITHGGCIQTSASTVIAIKFAMSSGNIASGTITLFGLRG